MTQQKPLNILTTPFVILLTVPAGIALAIGLLPLFTVQLEKSFAKGDLSPWVLQFNVESAHTALSVVATGAMTALSLAYSMVLLVFTLAAGNIGPRLLKRFTTDVANQITAGIFGGTFLYSLITLFFTQPDFVPKFTIAGAGLLAVVTVLQLIYFVRHVSRSVTIDEEIAEITGTLSNALNAFRKEAREGDPALEDDTEFSVSIPTPRAGYVGNIDEEGLIKTASSAEVVLRLEITPGRFALEDEPLISATGELEEDTRKKILELIPLDRSRTQDRSIEFSVNLLVEIALRALSPGVNDTYTAIAVADSLSNAFSEIAQTGHRAPMRTDDEEAVRLVLPGLFMSQLVGQAFHPLRRATPGNILMAIGLARALARLYAAGGKDMRDLIGEHAELLFKELEKAGHLDQDIESVRDCLPKELFDSGKGRAKKR